VIFFDAIGFAVMGLSIGYALLFIVGATVEHFTP
jgi:hypothetical protein